MTRYFVIFAALATISCRPASPETTEQVSIPLPDCGTELVFERSRAHPYLAEYHRTVSLRRAGQEIARIQLAMDSGGIGPLALYALASGGFLLKDPLYAYAVTCDGLSVAATAAEIPAGAVLLGHFEATAASTLAFDSAGPGRQRRD
jgi:hypothetical protein